MESRDSRLRGFGDYIVWWSKENPEKAEVYISFAPHDGAGLAKRLQRDLAKENVRVWLDRREGGGVWNAEVESALGVAEIVVAVLTEGSYASDICRAEQIRTLRQGKCLIPVRGERAARIPPHLAVQRVLDLTEGEYAERLKELTAAISQRAGASLDEAHKITQVTAPALPENYVSRQVELERLRDDLSRETGPRCVALTARMGLGGIGTTVLAQALCRDQYILEAFPDGVIWIPAGEASTQNVASRLRDVGVALGDEPGRYDTQSSAMRQFANLMKQKAALLVVDDVRNQRDLRLYLAESPRSRILFTTRDSLIAAAVGAREHVLGLPAEDNAKELLARWAGVRKEDMPAEAAMLAVVSGRTPLALAMIGAMVRGRPPEAWADTYKLIRGVDAGRLRQAFPGPDDLDCFRVIEASLSVLESDLLHKYLLMGVLPEEVGAHPGIQQALWGGTGAEARETAQRFVTLGLAQYQGAAGEIRLHDLQLEYLRARFPEHATLDLILGAIRLSAAAILKDPRQFTSQVIGRLLAYEDQEMVQAFTTLLANSAPWPWLRPLTSVLTPAGAGLTRILDKHSDGVYGVAVCPGGRLAVSASWDKTLVLWNLETGRELRVMKGHTGAVSGVAVSRDGKRAVSASWDNTVRVWDLETGREIGTLEGHTNQVEAVALTPDGRLAVSASFDKTLRVWDLENLAVVLTLRGHSDGVTAVAIGPSGEWAVSASSDKTLAVWDLVSGHLLRTLKGHTDGVTGVALSPDGRTAVSSSWDRTLKVWELTKARELRTITGHADGVRGVAVSPDGQHVASSSFDNTVRVWNLGTGREVRTLRGHTSAVWDVAWTPDGNRLLSASTDHTVGLWEVASEGAVTRPGGHEGWVWDVAVSPDGRRAVSASFDNTLEVWDVESRKPLRMLKGHAGAVCGVAFSPDGQRALSGASDGRLIVWDLDSGHALCTIEGHSNGIFGVAVSPDGQWIISASADGSLRMWDLENSRALKTFSGHRGGASAVAVCPDGKRVVSASFDKTLKIWDVETGEALCTLEGHTDRVNRVAISPDGGCVVSGSSDKTLIIWDLDARTAIRTLEGHTNAVYGVGWSPDGRHVVSASEDKTVRVWDPATGSEIAAFTADAPPACCRFAGAETIVVGESGGWVHFLALEK